MNLEEVECLEEWEQQLQAVVFLSARIRVPMYDKLIPNKNSN